jgi:hypothetical protein
MIEVLGWKLPVFSPRRHRAGFAEPASSPVHRPSTMRLQKAAPAGVQLERPC